MIVIGLTGGLGTGKSTVAGMFASLGAAVLDADRLAHEALAPGRAAWRRVVAAFGRAVLNGDRTINRQALAGRVFADRKALTRLEAIVHPQVFRRLRRRLGQLRRAGRVKAAVVEVPLLLETGAQRWMDAVVVVTAPASVVRRRLRARGFSRTEIGRRAAAQWKLSAKVALADYVIDNANGVANTQRQVRRVWQQVT